MFLLFLPGSALQTSTQPQPSKKEPDAQASDDRGLLLGMYFPNSATWEMLRNAGLESKWVSDISPKPHGKYLTFWIFRQKGEVKIRSMEGLLVPRKNGFWRVGTQIVKSGDSEDADFDEQFWAAPADKREPQPLKVDREINGQSTSLITYAGPEYISYLSHWQGGALLWEYQYTHVSPLDNLTRKLSIGQVLGPQASAVYKGLSQSLDHMNDEPEPDEGGCTCCTGLDSEWGLIHVGDQWQAYARFHEGTNSSCSQRWQDEVLRTSIPHSVWSSGRVDEPWDAVRKKLESVLNSEKGSVQHLFLSPKRDFAVSVSTSGLVVFGVRDKIQFSILKKQNFAAACIPVSEQWSMGRFVVAWDAEMLKQKPAAIPAEAGR